MSISRKDLLSLLENLGCKMTERQLRYLEEKGWIEKPEKIGREVYYKYVTLNDILLIHNLKQVTRIICKERDRLTEIIIPERDRKYVEAFCRKNEVSR